MSRYAAGIDVGTAYTKALILSSDGSILARCLEKTGFQPDQVAGRCLATALDTASLARNDLCAVVSTGFARHLVGVRTMAVTELTAAARGARQLFPGAHTVLDVGGQTIKACRLDAAAGIQAFRLNDKCAAGTGAFLERTARIMGLPLEAIDGLIAGSTRSAPISSVCAVFAESEIINQLVQETLPRDIMRGTVSACVERAAQIALRVGMRQEVCLVGGVLKFASAVALLREKLACAARIPDTTMVQFVAALGAARIGIRFGKQQGRNKDDQAVARAHDYREER
jgi:predicted CoA-substrate-specific enzyme activase